MKDNKPILYKLANPFGITIYMFIGIAMLMGAIYRFLSNEHLLGVTSLIGGCSFILISVYLIRLFRKSEKEME